MIFEGMELPIKMKYGCLSNLHFHGLSQILYLVLSGTLRILILGLYIIGIRIRGNYLFELLVI